METTENAAEATVLTAEEQQKKNIQNVQNAVKYAGFGEALRFAVKEEMLKGQDEFQLKYKPEFAANGEAILHFRKSKQDYYFFNKFELELTGKDQSSVKRLFYVNNPDKIEGQGLNGQATTEYVNSNFSLKEAFNLLEGRSVLKEFTKPDKEDKEQLVKYKAWVLLNFKESDKHGNYKFIKRPEFDLAGKLAELGFRDMDVEQSRNQLLASLEKGNRQSSTVLIAGRVESYEVAANPDFRSVNVYNRDNIPVKHHRLKAALQKEQAPAEAPGVEQTQGSGQTQASGSQQKAEESQGKKQEQKQGEQPEVKATRRRSRTIK